MSEEIITVWKSTERGGEPVYGSKALPQPKDGKPGKWHDVGQDPIPCALGVHGCRTLVDMLQGGWLREELYVAELRGPIVDAKNKVVGRSGRLCYRVEVWNEQTARLFAADCAETVAHLHPIAAPTIRVARRYAFGLATPDELSAARATADAAARVVAWATADAAARVAAWAAADAAARVAARATADAAARVAARATADAAAGVAAWAAADAAARVAAEAAAFQRMALRLHDYLTGRVDIEVIRRGVE